MHFSLRLYNINMNNNKLCEKIIIAAANSNPADWDDFKKIEHAVLKETGDPLPKGADMLGAYKQLVAGNIIDPSENLERILKFKKTRTLSGVAPVAILTKPYPCPGKCIFCPDEKNMPKSYLSDEPAVMRAIRAEFDAKQQVVNRLMAMEATGHHTDKVELIILGGTFSVLGDDYRTKFVKHAFDGLNKKDSRSIEEAHAVNEKAARRCIGLTVETRPDFIDENEILLLRKLGVTRVELGVQSLYDEILENSQRGHSVNETINATRLLKDHGFKVGYHMMPNLPGADIASDRKMFSDLHEKSDFQPDQLKIYPCVAVGDSPLYDMYIDGKFAPYSEKQLVDLSVDIKKEIPRYIRISRLFRDIPTPRISAGVRNTNLRQIIKNEMEKKGLICNCIRCREIRDREILENVRTEVFTEEYEASNGREIFISVEDSNRSHLLAFLRLRFPSLHDTEGKPLFKTLEISAIIREVHTYGSLTPIGDKGRVQHGGLGKKLIAKAEEIAKGSNFKNIVVISGVGAREYYRNLGYVLSETYMTKRL